MAIDSVAALFAAAALKTKAVVIGGAEVLVRELSIEARNAFLDAHRCSPADGVASLLCAAVIGPDGVPLLDADKAKLLVRESGAFAQELAAAVIKLSGMGDDSGNE